MDQPAPQGQQQRSAGWSVEKIHPSCLSVFADRFDYWKRRQINFCEIFGWDKTRTGLGDLFGMIESEKWKTQM